MVNDPLHALLKILSVAMKNHHKLVTELRSRRRCATKWRTKYRQLEKFVNENLDLKIDTEKIHKK